VDSSIIFQGKTNIIKLPHRKLLGCGATFSFELDENDHLKGLEADNLKEISALRMLEGDILTS
ncbi:hypothetical protein SO802_035194, partial [Lithocarpus litseifolius]